MHKLLWVVVLLAGCDPNTVVLGPPDDCKSGAMRCEANRVEICGSDERWVVSADCEEVGAYSGGQWVCTEGEGDAEPYCERVTEGDGGSDGSHG